MLTANVCEGLGDESLGLYGGGNWKPTACMKEEAIS